MPDKAAAHGEWHRIVRIVEQCEVDAGTGQYIRRIGTQAPEDRGSRQDRAGANDPALADNPLLQSLDFVHASPS